MIRHFTNMFIQVASDCPVAEGVTPISKRALKPAHLIQYELLMESPYRYTFEDQLFEVYKRHKGYEMVSDAEELEKLRAELLSKNHPCLRASQLTKKFGWGVHFNADGKIAIYGMETEKYNELKELATNGTEIELQVAIRSSRR
ncbi:hypothetical protein I6N90_02930 [Paenibacillus sp. GSMTC-2017]|uniref:DUF6157 family protein n=1 Tax=Paenibacillus sp. GSMTC-2017 TaxID=2794350 RepID=UPI0018D7D1AA|nr:DUF6157 family protein [Paenibacillus sp. GSMTC-2017]MBH5316764.1 hypothetical protein [Paenibacillus sp. GSMTC-2017]